MHRPEHVGYVSVRYGRVVALLTAVTVLRQRRLDRLGGIVRPEPLRDRPPKDRRDPHPYPVRGLRSPVPYRVEHREDVRRGHLVHRHRCQRARVVLETATPLVSRPPGVLPPRLPHDDHLLRALAESGDSAPTSNRSRIVAPERRPLHFKRHVPRLRQRHHRPSAEPVVNALAVHGAPPYPRSSAGCQHPEPEPELIAVHPRTRRPHLPLIQLTCHA